MNKPRFFVVSLEDMDQVALAALLSECPTSKDLTELALNLLESVGWDILEDREAEKAA